VRVKELYRSVQKLMKNSRNLGELSVPNVIHHCRTCFLEFEKKFDNSTTNAIFKNRASTFDADLVAASNSPKIK